MQAFWAYLTVRTNTQIQFSKYNTHTYIDRQTASQTYRTDVNVFHLSRERNAYVFLYLFIFFAVFYSFSVFLCFCYTIHHVDVFRSVRLPCSFCLSTHIHNHKKKHTDSMWKKSSRYALLLKWFFASALVRFSSTKWLFIWETSTHYQL